MTSLNLVYVLMLVGAFLLTEMNRRKMIGPAFPAIAYVMLAIAFLPIIL